MIIFNCSFVSERVTKEEKMLASAWPDELKLQQVDEDTYDDDLDDEYDDEYDDDDLYDDEYYDDDYEDDEYEDDKVFWQLFLQLLP